MNQELFDIPLILRLKTQVGLGFTLGGEAADRIVQLEAELAAAKSDAEYAVRNMTTFENARQEEMRKRDVVEAALAEATRRNGVAMEAMKDVIDNYNFAAAQGLVDAIAQLEQPI